MTEEMTPNVDLYTRNGFAGPITTVIRPTYTPNYLRADGEYVSKTINIFDVKSSDKHTLSTPILESMDTVFEVTNLSSDMDYAIRNVYADEIHICLAGSATLATDFGELDVEPGDIIHISRSVSYKLKNITKPITILKLVSESELKIAPDHVPGVLNPDLDVHAPTPVNNPSDKPKEHEVVIRHKDGTTSFFYDADPMQCLDVIGISPVSKFNLENVHGLGCRQGLVLPPLLIDDKSTRTLIYHMGDREVGRPPIHHNADYDEIIVYVKGPGQYGEITAPGTLAFTPKGLVHQGPLENVPEGYQAILFETRSSLTMTEAFQNVASPMDMDHYGKRKDA